MPIPPGYSELPSTAYARYGAEAVWTYIGTESVDHLVLPDGRCDVILRFETDGQRTLGDISIQIAGPATIYHNVSMKRGIAYIGARLRPGLASAMLGLDLSTLTNQGLSGQTVMRVVPDLAALCRPCNQIAHLVDRMSDWVDERSKAVSAPARLLEMIDTIHVCGGRLSVCNLANTQSVAIRTLRRDFKAGTGISPKQYSDIVRFHRALRLLCNDHLDAASVAAEAGYADQAHMTRNFRKFGGFTPANIPQVTRVNLPF